MHRISFGFVCLLSVVCAACEGGTPGPTPVNPTAPSNVPNPASVYCEENGGRLELRTDASGGASGVCVFPDGTECDEWAFFRGECGPTPPTSAATTPADTAFPTPVPIDPAEYDGWWKYTHAEYGFTLQLPPDWVVDETASGDPLLSGHLLWLHADPDTALGPRLRLTFRRAGEDVLLWPTGAGEGEFVPQGTLDVAGQAARRILFVCLNGQIESVYYQGEPGPNLERGGLEFGLIFTHSGERCSPDAALAGKTLHSGELIVASLVVP